MPNPVNREESDVVYRHAPLADRLRRWLEALAGAALPCRCLLCGERGGQGMDLCAACRLGLPACSDACRRCALPLPFRVAAMDRPPDSVCGACLQRPPPLDAVHAAFVYAPPLDRLLPRFKFHQDLAAGRLLAGLMATALAAAERPQALLPVPLHGSRLRRRGYDQALELARSLARERGLPLQAHALHRIRATAAQSDLDAARRSRNLRGAFRVADGAVLPAHVALVDDVMTTGATLHAAAMALRRAGVVRVDAWVCARVP